jgi:hypothetical protein
MRKTDQFIKRCEVIMPDAGCCNAMPVSTSARRFFAGILGESAQNSQPIKHVALHMAHRLQ